MSKFLIVGLGNVGVEYVNTRHNIGFKTVEAFASASTVPFLPDRLASVAEVRHKGKTFILIKPTTFMNLSGKAVNYWMQAEKVSIENTLVITDDLALPFGTLRLKSKGSDGGHNGLKSIQETLGNVNYPRLRFGIGSEFLKGQQVGYVLGEWTMEQQILLGERISQAVEIIKSFGSIGIERTMTLFNNK